MEGVPDLQECQIALVLVNDQDESDLTAVESLGTQYYIDHDQNFNTIQDLNLCYFLCFHIIIRALTIFLLAVHDSFPFPFLVPVGFLHVLTSSASANAPARPLFLSLVIDGFELFIPSP